MGSENFEEQMMADGGGEGGEAYKGDQGVFEGYEQVCVARMCACACVPEGCWSGGWHG